MQRVLSWIFTPLHIALFLLILGCFHVPLVITRLLFGERAMWVVLERMCFSLITNIRLTGSRVEFTNEQKLPTKRPIIFICNHQCMYDIPYILWYLRKFKPRFISKKELGKGFPSISYALRNGSQLLINRKDPTGAIAAISEFGKKLANSGGSIVMFPEGTRARDGMMKPFKPRGLVTLLEACPDALIVPLVIKGSWEHMRYKFWPVPFGIHVVLKVLEPIEQSKLDANEVVLEAQKRIRTALLSLGGEVRELPTKNNSKNSAAIAS